MPTRKVRKPCTPTAAGKRTIAGWRANALDLQLENPDLELLDIVLTVTPLLRVVAAVGKEARRRGLTYPVPDVSALVGCLGSDSLRYGDHHLDAHTITHAMSPSWFPIVHEGEFLSRVHLALLRCAMEASQSAPRAVFVNR
jgi:hypothetical protein